MSDTEPKVLHILPALHHAGAELLVLELLRTGGSAAALVSLAPVTPEWADRLSALGVRCFTVEKHPGPDFAVPFRLLRLFRRERPIVVHTHLSALAYAFVPMLLCRIPVRVHTLHNEVLREAPPLLRWLNRLAFHLGVVPAVVSKRLRTEAEAYYRVPVAVVPNGVAPERIPRRTGKTAHRGMRILCAGRLTPQKNQPLLLEVFARLHEEFSVSELHFFGDGPLLPALQSRTAALNLKNAVFFHGLCPDLTARMSGFDVLALPSLWEGLPLTLLEAMACGLPTVAAAVGGAPDALRDGREGFLVAPGDAVTLHEALRRFALCPALIETMGANARKRARAYALSRTAAGYAALYRRLWKERAL